MSSPSTSLGSHLQVYKIHMHKIEPLRWLIIMAKPYIYKLRSLTYLYLSKATPTHRKAEPLRWLMLRTRIWFWTLNGWKDFVTSRCVCVRMCVCVCMCVQACACACWIMTWRGCSTEALAQQETMRCSQSKTHQRNAHQKYSLEMTIQYHPPACAASNMGYITLSSVKN